MIGHFLTDTGLVRSHNEDAGGIYTNDHGQMLVMVADGMGGHRAGDVASSIATSFLHQKWDETGFIPSPDDAEKWLEEGIQEANQKIFQHAIEHEECKGMGTTIVAAIIGDDFASVAHVGDSRCYVSNSYGFTQVTEDHSLVNELVRSGQISPEDAEHHPRKNVLLKALGTSERVDVDIKSIEWEEDNYLILCSDGLSNKVSDDELHQYMIESESIEEAAKQLITLANERGGEDNITLALIHYDESTKEGES
ncbi:protein phosphatase [Melghiribacillus thermohalophilus]|uniref:protein-serine/threonine phosphatase n=1 Tax=Melghiribacillus thermohalophilus TaxID=1324956 RepID=A0A4V2V2X5_9BACI|nr:Stp1/IreP family PP2C-type Ser/Thr phosphatase [Melghiribacillus thermohalophilus]TCT26821.1 protein phosphatase [Melghiribacillus thermohalophilus]